MFGDARRTDGYACASIVRVSGSVGNERVRRPLHRVLKPSPTIGDLAGSDFREVQLLAEARAVPPPLGGLGGGDGEASKRARWLTASVDAHGRVINRLVLLLQGISCDNPFGIARPARYWRIEFCAMQNA